MKRPLNVCHVLLSLRPGGLENGVVNVVNGLDRGEFHSSVCCLQESGEFAARINNGAQVVSMGLKPGNDMGLPLRLARLFRSLGADIVHTRNAEPFFYGLVGARLAGVPVVIHSEHGRTFPEKPLRARVQRWLLTNVNSAFAVSRRLQQDLVRELGVRPGRFEVLYNGVDLGRFQPRSYPQGGQSPVVIGSVGRLVPVKNYSLLLAALAKLPPGTAKVVLVGDGPERERLQGEARALGLEDRVSFAGHRDDIPAALAEMDIFVLPSISEGMSNTMLEAMAAGVAVVASDVGGNSELIEDGVTGLLFPSGDVDRAAEKIGALVSDAGLRERLARAAVQKVQEEFSIDAMLKRYATMYQRVWSQVRGELGR